MIFHMVGRQGNLDKWKLSFQQDKYVAQFDDVMFEMVQDSSGLSVFAPVSLFEGASKERATYVT